MTIAADWLQPLHERASYDVASALKRLMDAIIAREVGAEGGDVPDDAPDVDASMMAFAQAIGKGRMASGLFGGMDMAREVNAASPARVEIPQQFKEADLINDFGDVTFNEAVRAFRQRYPVMRHVADQLATQFAPESLFWVSKAANESITKRVKAVLSKALADGTTVQDFERATRRIAASTASWSSSYLHTVFRTNLASAYAEGRRIQARNPDLEGFVVGWEYQAVGDKDTRDNHEAANGIIWSVEDDATAKLMKVPRGFQCRCSHRMLTKPEATNLGIVDKLKDKRILKRSGGRIRVVGGVPRDALPTNAEMVFLGGYNG